MVAHVKRRRARESKKRRQKREALGGHRDQEGRKGAKASGPGRAGYILYIYVRSTITAQPARPALSLPGR